MSWGEGAAVRGERGGLVRDAGGCAPGEGGEGGEEEDGLADENVGDAEDEAGGADGVLKAGRGVDEDEHVDGKVGQHDVEPGES